MTLPRWTTRLNFAVRQRSASVFEVYTSRYRLITPCRHPNRNAEPYTLGNSDIRSNSKHTYDRRRSSSTGSSYGQCERTSVLHLFRNLLLPRYLSTSNLCDFRTIRALERRQRSGGRQVSAVRHQRTRAAARVLGFDTDLAVNKNLLFYFFLFIFSFFTSLRRFPHLGAEPTRLKSPPPFLKSRESRDTSIRRLSGTINPVVWSVFR